MYNYSIQNKLFTFMYCEINGYKSFGKRIDDEFWNVLEREGIISFNYNTLKEYLN